MVLKQKVAEVSSGQNPRVRGGVSE